MMPDIFFYEKIDFENPQDLSRLTSRDLLFVESEKVDELWKLNRTTACQLALVGDKQLDDSLVDYYVSEKDLRGAVLSFGAYWQQMTSLRTSFHALGPLRRPALFLDRDGVVLEYREYPKDVSEVRLNAGIAQLIVKAHQKGMVIVIVTNQSGLGRGYYDWQAYDQVTARMLELLAQEKCYVDQVLKAPFYEKSILSYGMSRKSLRKPRPGMIHSVVEELGIDLQKSILIGDTASDLMTADLAGVGQAWLLDSPRREQELQKWRQWPLLSRSLYGLQVKVLGKFSDLPF
jgi:D-glycero-D-manno-heptose 1,7-bisphosphate phosphatase